MDEENSKAEGRGEMTETELLIMDQFTILVRDLYAFYPLLIRFVDYNRYVINTTSFLNVELYKYSCLLVKTIIFGALFMYIYLFQTWQFHSVKAAVMFLQSVVSHSN